MEYLFTEWGPVMIVAIHQPNYLPWIGFFDKMNKCDKFIILDNVQYVDRLYQQRTRIKTPKGWMWLTVPVKHKYELKPDIKDILIDKNDGKWKKKHWKSLLMNYSKAPFFEENKDAFNRLYEREWERLVDLNEQIIKSIAQILGIKVEFERASRLPVNGKKTELLISICKSVGATAYLSGPTGRDYLGEKRFEEEGIKLLYQDFNHPLYPQLWGEFLPNMSVVDFIFNQGLESRKFFKPVIVKKNGAF